MQTIATTARFIRPAARPAAQEPTATFRSAIVALWRDMMEDDEDRRERHLAQSADHDDFAKRERAWDDQQKRARAMRAHG